MNFHDFFAVKLGPERSFTNLTGLPEEDNPFVIADRCRVLGDHYLEVQDLYPENCRASPSITYNVQDPSFRRIVHLRKLLILDKLLSQKERLLAACKDLNLDVLAEILALHSYGVTDLTPMCEKLTEVLSGPKRSSFSSNNGFLLFSLTWINLYSMRQIYEQWKSNNSQTAFTNDAYGDDFFDQALQALENNDITLGVQPNRNAKGVMFYDSASKMMLYSPLFLRDPNNAFNENLLHLDPLRFKTGIAHEFAHFFQHTRTSGLTYLDCEMDSYLVEEKLFKVVYGTTTPFEKEFSPASIPESLLAPSRKKLADAGWTEMPSAWVIDYMKSHEEELSWVRSSSQVVEEEMRSGKPDHEARKMLIDQYASFDVLMTLINLFRQYEEYMTAPNGQFIAHMEMTPSHDFSFSTHVAPAELEQAIGLFVEELIRRLWKTRNNTQEQAAIRDEFLGKLPAKVSQFASYQKKFDMHEIQ